MLAIDRILIERFKEGGVAGSTRTQPPRHTPVRIPNCCLQYVKKQKHGSRTIEEERFTAGTSRSALKTVRQLLGIHGTVTNKNFHKAGGRFFSYGGIQLFPKARAKKH